jgi:hypothetical protein
MCVAAILCTVYFVLIVFACIALNHTDVERFYIACRSDFRNFIMADLIVGIVIPIGCAIFVLAARRWTDPLSAVVVGCVLAVCCCAVSVYLGYFTLVLRSYALKNAECTVVMKSIDNWFDQSSTDRGSSLLAVVGVVYGVLYTVLAAVILCCLVYAFFRCVVYALRWRSAPEPESVPWDPV